MKYTVRVTRDYVEETVALTIYAENWEAAKARAIEKAKDKSNLYFLDEPEEEYYVAGMDDDEEAAKEDE